VTKLDDIRQELGEPRAFIAHVRSTLGVYGLSQRKLALQIDMAPENLNAIMRGRRTPQLPTMLRINEGLKELIYGR
jgi:transcriptional regulator with XRE-family HTH domain